MDVALPDRRAGTEAGRGGGRAAMTSLFASLPARTHPLLTTHVSLLNYLDGGGELGFGPCCLLDGIAATPEGR
ncbi:hypothetical protein ACWDBD_33785 [Streptomyces sp. NPDC001118]|uniref:hypothetical protein n=1 Tax=unclassified Streptomyces TaxID=2593676 RepID=UPI00331FFCD5